VSTVRAIVLGKESFGEADYYVDFLTEEYGRFTAVAKAAKRSRRRYAGGLDLFCHDEIALRGDPAGRPYLVELVVLNAFLPLRENLDRAAAAGRCLQWIRRLVPPNAPLPGLFKLLGQTLALLARAPSVEATDRMELLFRLQFLSRAGLAPRLDGCARCGSDGPIAAILSPEAGGVLCVSCQAERLIPDGLRLAADERSTLLRLEQARAADWAAEPLPAARLPSLNRLLAQFASYHGHVAPLP
jgi:DNA repair protein RecO (recombination protein O)